MGETPGPAWPWWHRVATPRRSDGSVTRACTRSIATGVSAAGPDRDRDHQSRRRVCAGTAGGTGRAADERTGRGAADQRTGAPRSRRARQARREARKRAAAAQPTTAPAVAKPKGSITIVLESEPDTILPKDATTDNAMFMMANVYSALTYRQFDQLGQPPKIVPHLAESFEQNQSDPKTWRFKLRKGDQVPQRRDLQRRRGGHHDQRRVGPVQAGPGPRRLGPYRGQRRQGRRLHRRCHDQGARCHPAQSVCDPGDRGARLALQQPEGRPGRDRGRHRAIQAGRVQAAQVTSCSRPTRTTGARRSRPSARSRSSSATSRTCGPA